MALKPLKGYSDLRNVCHFKDLQTLFMDLKGAGKHTRHRNNRKYIKLQSTYQVNF